MVITKIAHTGDQRTLFIFRELLGDRCRLGLNSKDSIYCRGVNSFQKRGGGDTVYSDGFYAEISSNNQMQQCKSCLKSVL